MFKELDDRALRFVFQAGLCDKFDNISTYLTDVNSCQVMNLLVMGILLLLGKPYINLICVSDEKPICDPEHDVCFKMKNVILFHKDGRFTKLIWQHCTILAKHMWDYNAIIHSAEVNLVG